MLVSYLSGKGRNTISGHWASTSRMPGRYERSVGANELLLRNTIVNKMAGGWELADAFHLPTKVTGDERIGKGTGGNPLPAHTGGPIADRSIANDDALPTVSDGAQDAFTQDTKADCPSDRKVELTQTQLTDDSKN